MTPPKQEPRVWEIAKASDDIGGLSQVLGDDTCDLYQYMREPAFIKVLEATPAARHAEDMLELLREMVHFGASGERLKLAQTLLARIEAERKERG